MKKMLYAILSKKNDQEKLNTLLIGMKGVARADLYSVSIDEISAVVCDIKGADFITDKTNAIEYAGVIENLAQQFTLLPMQYGSLLESTDLINKMLERNYPKLQQNLQKVENKYEFGLKVFCDSENLKAELRTKSESVNTLTSNITTENENSVYKEYVNKKLKEHKLEELLSSYVDSIVAEFTIFLAKLNAISKFKKMESPSNIIDAVFLLGKDKKDELVLAVEDLQNKYPGLKFILTGPWSPYNFIDITIK